MKNAPFQLIKSQDCFNERGKATLLNVPRPLCTNQSILVALSATSSKIYELHAIQARNEDRRCWFVDQLVVSDPHLITATPLDPTFILSALLLSIPEYARNTYSRYDDIIDTLRNTFPESRDLLPLLESDALKSVTDKCCDSKELSEDELVYKFSTEKFMEYIDRKISRCLSVITAERDIKSLEPSPHHLLTPELALPNAQRESYKKNIIDTILYSIPRSLHAQIKERHPMPDLDAHEEKASKEKFKSDTLIRSNKGYDEGKELDNDDKQKKPAKGTRGSEQLKKVDTRKMMKLDGFFAKKPAKTDQKENDTEA
ncbi:hypothetical protein E3Q22_04424 [Wallemia mellicola]|uniref:Ribonuclease H2 subunit B n=1 Tax=Wallemia mellicola TaxID=1708541 RepID=A0A4T0NRW3_9BASI|nr:hypothetical protein E3Q22_04424 [Wallemia mellicola]TIB99268.1 hypothetical protein E3Q16_04211 [Wallemia mellicola]TIC36655.1 hypothetical protein E3Q08_04252 [Wallemia mellicola]